MPAEPNKLSDGHLANIQSDLNDVKQSIKTIAEALTKLAVLEDRQSVTTTVMEKILTRLERVEDKQHLMELQAASDKGQAERLAKTEEIVSVINAKLIAQEAQKQTIGVGVRALWAIFGGVITSGIVGAIMLYGAK